LSNVALTLLIGRYALDYLLGARRKATLGETVQGWKEYLPLGYLPLAHPSPRNRPWLTKNPRFEEELVEELRAVIQTLKL
jgi:uracil-DNA glycosylase